MHDFHTLGRIDLRQRGGRECQSILAQPKRTALLCYLVLSKPGRFQRRDTLLAVFWPEHGEERGRAALRQALYFLEQSLGGGIVLRRGKEEVGVDTARFWCDVSAFDAAISQGRDSDALELFSGPLLKGFHLAGAPDFEQWLERERERLNTAARRAARKLLDRAAAAGDLTRTAHWAHRSIELAPDDEDAPLRLITLLESTGDRAGALREYDAYARMLRTEYELEPGAAIAAAGERLRERAHSPPTPSPPPDSASAGPPPLVDPASPGAVGAKPAAIRAVFEAPAAFDGPAAADLRPPAARSKHYHRALTLTVLFAAIGGAALVISSTDTRPVPMESLLQPGLIAVPPFAVADSDSRTGALSQGPMHLLAAALTGAGGLQTVDPRTMLHEWTRAKQHSGADPAGDAPLEIARRLGASRLLLCSLIEIPDGISVTASLIDVASGRILLAITVTKAADSLSAILDHIAAQVLGAEAGLDNDRLASFAGRSLPQLREYVAGVSLHRRGQAVAAAGAFQRALDIDSSFALAALGLHESVAMGPRRFSSDVAQRAERLAWAFRDRLSTRDQLRLQARFGERYPDWTHPGDQIRFLERAVAEVRTDPVLWQAVGSAYFHAGALLGVADARERARDAFSRALELDSTLSWPRLFLQHLAVETRDTVALRRLARRLPTGGQEDETTWLNAVVLGDTAAAGRLRSARFGSFTDQALRRMVYESLSFGIALDDGETALAVLHERAASNIEREDVLQLERIYHLNRGHPSRAARVIASSAGTSRAVGRGREQLREALFDAVYWDGDHSRAAAAAAELETRVARPPVPEARRMVEDARDLCALEQWRLAAGDSRTASRSITLLRNAASAMATEREKRRTIVCAAVLDGMLAGNSDASAALLRLDSLTVAAVPGWMPEDAWLYSAIMAGARLWAAHGYPERALAAVRRRGEAGDAVIMLAPFLREEGRLAGLTGDHAAAARAYRHYLLLRSGPQSKLVPQLDSVRSELARLEYAH